MVKPIYDDMVGCHIQNKDKLKSYGWSSNEGLTAAKKLSYIWTTYFMNDPQRSKNEMQPRRLLNHLNDVWRELSESYYVRNVDFHIY